MPFKGTDKKAYYSKTVKNAKTPDEKSKAYYIEKAKNQKGQKGRSASSDSWSSLSNPKKKRHTPSRMSGSKATQI